MTANKEKKLDCLKMKEEIQKKLIEKLDGLTHEQEISKTREIIVSDEKLGRWYKEYLERLKKAS